MSTPSLRPCAVLLLLLALLLPRSAGAAPNPADDVQRQVDDAMIQVRQAMPVLQQTLEVLRSETPRLVEAMKRASEVSGTLPRGAKRDASGLPSQEELAAQLRGLEALLGVLRETLPSLQRIQSRLPEAARVRKTPAPSRSSPAPTPPSPAPETSRPAEPDSLPGH